MSNANLFEPLSELGLNPISANKSLLFPNPRPLQLWAFLENSDFQRYKNGSLYRQDEVALVKHDLYLDRDYQLLADIHCVGVRDAARWYLTNPRPGQFDWTWLDRVVAIADKHRLRLYIDLWHYGYPDWLDLMSVDAISHFANFARQIAVRYPSIRHYSICNEPGLLVDMGGRQGMWGPFRSDPLPVYRQVCQMIIEASKAVLAIRPDALLVLPEPWHATTNANSEDQQAAVIDAVLGRREPDLGGADALISIIGLNHYRDSTLPPLHKLLLNAQARWPDKPLWLTETSGPPVGWQQEEWFWWMLAETRLANLQGAAVDAFTWAPAMSMYDWVDETLPLPNGIWRLGEHDERIPNGNMLQAIALARDYGYIA